MSCKNCYITPKPLPTGVGKRKKIMGEILQIDGSRSPNPVLVVNDHQFLLWNQNITLEFLPVKDGYKILEYEFGILINTYVKKKPFKYIKNETEAFVGTFKNQRFEDLTFSTFGGDLHLGTVNKNGKYTLSKLNPVARDLFFHEKTRLEFFRNELDQVTRVQQSIQSINHFFEKID